MDKRIKKLWIDALTGKSKKKYTQGKDKLRDNGNFCCLGVLCDLHRIEFHNSWDGDEEFRTYYDADFALPQTVFEWAGLEDENPDIFMGKYEDTLAGLNDSGSTFNEIAQIIKQQL